MAAIFYTSPSLKIQSHYRLLTHPFPVSHEKTLPLHFQQEWHLLVVPLPINTKLHSTSGREVLSGTEITATGDSIHPASEDLGLFKSGISLYYEDCMIAHFKSIQPAHLCCILLNTLICVINSAFMGKHITGHWIKLSLKYLLPIRIFANESESQELHSVKLNDLLKAVQVAR